MPTLLSTPRTAPAGRSAAAHSPAARPAAVVALVYLAVSFPALFLNPEIPWGTVAAHLAALVGVAWAARLRHANPLADWLPLLLTAFFYAELPALIGGISNPAATGYRDGVVQGWEAVVFGGQPAQTLAGSFPWQWLSELVHAGYLAYYPLIFGPPLILYLRGRREAFAGTQLALLATFVACYAVFILFPVEGPRYAWPAPPGIPDGPIRGFALWLLEGGSSRGTAFPSSHAAVAVAASVVGLRYQPRVGWAAAVTTILLVVGAVYGGFHYAIDMAAGILIGLLVSLAALRWFARKAA